MTDLRKFSAAPASRHIPDWLLPLGVFLLLSLCIVIPFFFYGTASGHDFEFHSASWFDVASQWKQGVLYPRWTAWTNHGFGEPRFIFYPPLSWIIGAALTLLVPDVAVPIVFIVLIQTFAGLSAYFLLRNLVSRRAAILAAACYLFNPNALLMTYIRSDYAEQLACAFFPLVLLAALRLSGLLDNSRRKNSYIALFAIPYACVWLSNAPAGVIISYSVALLFAWAAFSQRSCQPLLRGAGGLALGLGLTAFYLIPAAYEQRWVNIGQALSSGLLPYQNFLFTEINDPEHTWFNWIASICAICLILILALAALASRRFAGNASQQNRNASLALLLLGAAATILTLRFTLPIWTFLPKLRFVQFPWRWMSILALVAVCFLAFAIEKRLGWLWFVILLFLSVPLAWFQTQNTWWDTDEMPTMRDTLNSGQGFDGVDEYDPVGDDHLDLPANAPEVRILPADSETSAPPKANVQVLHWTTKQKEIRVDTPSEARVALRVLNYPAWRVAVNGKSLAPERLDDINQMVVPVQAGTSTITVVFVRTGDRKLGDAVAAASGLIAIFLLWSGRKKSET
ncbi:MAG TPA: 6-pyruvoyl-tetrahydropterin synthase-related protein [Candidatus Acidoferrum sp.]|nr:6-pyruvoyl-tetrahydropterin synthase-related protein [Candidatus Acidoferrum sp.]